MDVIPSYPIPEELYQALKVFNSKNFKKLTEVSDNSFISIWSLLKLCYLDLTLFVLTIFVI